MYKAQYKCRLCGNEFTGEATNNEDLAMECMLYVTTEDRTFLSSSTIIHPERLTTHFCEDGSFGLADFIGFKK